ncbi:MAG: DUF2202 domain-containing protein [Ignavibacteria bacterium]|jgi:hypothetical protein
MKLTDLFGMLLTAAVLLFITVINGCGSNLTEYELDNTASITGSETSIDELSKTASAEYEESLIFMREEEKLARDIYLAMYNLYSLRVFNNISKSEQQHMDAIKVLLDRYGIEDPVTNDIVGEFKNEDLQNLYNQLYQTGSESKTEALKVGAAIEEIDILDLIEAMNTVEEGSDIYFVYDNLKKGSENHLRAFVRNLKANGIAYEPQYLDDELYNNIITKKGRRN